jgi:hypothetical protein
MFSKFFSYLALYRSVRKAEAMDHFLQRAAAAFLACWERSSGVCCLRRALVALAAFFWAAAILAGVRARPIAAAAFDRAFVIALGSIPRVDSC